MKRTQRLLSTLATLALAALPVASLLLLPAGASRTGQATTLARSREARIFELAAHAPRLSSEEIQRLIVESDRIVARVSKDLPEAETEAADVGAEVRHRLREVHVSDEEALAYFHENLELFGQRSFDDSRSSIDRLVALRKVWEELGLE